MSLAPQQQLSKVRGKKRYAAWLRLNAKRLKDLVSLQYNEAGVAIALSHFASPLTGEYNGRKIYTISQTGSKKTVKKIRA